MPGQPGEPGTEGKRVSKQKQQARCVAWLMVVLTGRVCPGGKAKQHRGHITSHYDRLHKWAVDSIQFPMRPASFGIESP